MQKATGLLFLLLALNSCAPAPESVTATFHDTENEVTAAPPEDAEFYGISFADADELMSHYIPGAVLLYVQKTGVKNRVNVYLTDKTSYYVADVDESVYRVFEIKRNGQPFYRWPGVHAIAHRTAVRFAPENTIAGIEKAIALGSHAIEFDVHETKDGEIVLMHDSSVNRTTNGKGKVRDLTLAQIKQLEAGSHFSDAYLGEPVPTLREALRAMKGRIIPDLEYKDGSFQKITQILREEGFLENGLPVMVYSGTNDDVEEFAKLSSAYFIRPKSNFGNLSLDDTIERFHPKYVFVISEIQNQKSYIRNLHKKGIKTVCGIAPTKIFEKSRTENVLDLYPDFVMTDGIPVLIDIAKQRGILALPQFDRL